MERRSALALLAALSIGGALAVPSAAAADTVLITGANSGSASSSSSSTPRRAGPSSRRTAATACPSRSRPSSPSIPNVRVERMDVASIEEVHALAAKLAGNADRRADQQRRHLQRPRGCADEACRGEDSTQSFGMLDYELFDTIMAVNVRGPLLVVGVLRRARPREPAEENRLDQLDERLHHVHARRLGRDRVSREQGRVEPRDAARRRQPEKCRRHRALCCTPAPC